jgi:hypothetical protein
MLRGYLAVPALSVSLSIFPHDAVLRHFFMFAARPPDHNLLVYHNYETQ